MEGRKGRVKERVGARAQDQMTVYSWEGLPSRGPLVMFPQTLLWGLLTLNGIVEFEPKTSDLKPVPLLRATLLAAFFLSVCVCSCLHMPSLCQGQGSWPHSQAMALCWGAAGSPFVSDIDRQTGLKEGRFGFGSLFVSDIDRQTGLREGLFWSYFARRV